MLPEGYRKLDEWKLDFGRMLVWQVLGIVALFASAFFFNLLIGFSLNFWNREAVEVNPFLIVFFIVAVLIVHELTHGVGILLSGAKPKYGIGLAFVVFPYLYTTTDKIVPRNNFIMFNSLPTVALTFIGVILMFLLPQYAALWFAAFTINFAGGIGDVWLVWTAYRYPRHVYVKDEKHGEIVYGRLEDKSLLNQSAQT